LWPLACGTIDPPASSCPPPASISVTTTTSSSVILATVRRRHHIAVEAIDHTLAAFSSFVGAVASAVVIVDAAIPTVKILAVAIIVVVIVAIAGDVAHENYFGRRDVGNLYDRWRGRRSFVLVIFPSSPPLGGRFSEPSAVMIVDGGVLAIAIIGIAIAVAGDVAYENWYLTRR
jgi:hypothetical protein